MRQRMSHGLRRALQVSRRLNESLDIARNLRRTLEGWVGAPPRFTPAHDVGSGAASFHAQLCGRAFRITIEPLDYEAADRIEWEPQTPSQVPESGLHGGRGGGSTENP